MGIPYPDDDVYVYDQIDGSSIENIIAGLYDKLTTAGLTLVDALKASVTLTFTGQPADTNTCAFNGTTYTAKNTPGAFPEFGIGATDQDTYVNLAAAIEATDADLDVTVNSGSLVIEWTTGGEAGNGFTASTGLANSSVNGGSGFNGGYMLAIPRTPDGLGAKVKIYKASAAQTNVSIRMYSEDELIESSEQWLIPATSRTLEVLACKHQFFVFLLGSSNTAGTELCCCVPSLLSPNYIPLTIAAIADNGGEIEVETDAAHGLTTGDHVFIAGGTIDGLFSADLNTYAQVTVIDATHYTMDGSVWPGGTYDADTGKSAGPNQVSRLFFICGSFDGLFYNTTFFRPSSMNNQNAFYCFNQYSHNTTGILKFKHLLRADNGAIVLNYGSYSDHLEAIIGWNLHSGGSTLYWIGRLWAAVMINDGAPIDHTKNDQDSRNWFQLVNAGTYSLWVVRSVV